jgi:hypothetical protein
MNVVIVPVRTMVSTLSQTGPVLLTRGLQTLPA